MITFEEVEITPKHRLRNKHIRGLERRIARSQRLIAEGHEDPQVVRGWVSLLARQEAHYSHLCGLQWSVNEI